MQFVGDKCERNKCSRNGDMRWNGKFRWDGEGCLTKKTA